MAKHMKQLHPAPDTPNGFTLIELMIVIVIVGILAAIAVPSYTDYISKARRTDALNGISNVALALERYYSINNAYPNDIAVLPAPSSSSSPDGYYDMSLNATVANANSSQFEILATRNNANPDDKNCKVFRLTQTGVKSATDDSPTDSTSTCWKVK